jgi:PAS domain S-box-containing protein
MTFKGNISLKLVGFMLAVSVLPMLLLQMVSYRAVLQTSIDVARAHNLQLLEIQIDYITQQTDQIESLTENPAWAKEIERLPLASSRHASIQESYAALVTKARIGQMLSGYSGTNFLETIDLFNVNGAHYHVGEKPNDPDDDSAELSRQMALASEAPGQTVWILVNGDRASRPGRRPIFAAIKSVYKSGMGDTKPELLGMLRINLSDEFLYDHFSALSLGQGTYLMMVGKLGGVVYHPNKTLIGQPVPSNIAPALVGPSGSILTSLDGEQVLLSHLQISARKGTLLSVVPYTALTAPLIPILRTSIATLVACLLVIAWFTRMYLHRVVYPIRDVSKGFRDFQANRLSTDWRLASPKAWLEIGDLVHWFNAFLYSAQLQRKATQELQVSEARIRGLISAIPDLIFINQRNGLFLDVHVGNAALLLHPPQDIRNRTIAELLPAPVAQQFMHAIAKALDSRELQELNYVLPIDGQAKYFEARFAATAHDTVISIVRDNTARKQLEDAQRIAATAFESELGMVITDAKRTILRVNKTFTRITGYSAEDAVGRTPRLLSSGSHDAAFYDEINQRLQRDSSWQGEVWNRRKSGEIYPVWLSISIVRDDDGNITNYVGSHHDITERKNSEDALTRLNLELAESRGGLRAMVALREARLEQEKKHIAREVHDELGQVLTALRMHLSMCIKDHGGLAPSLANELQGMKRLIDHAIAGVRDVAANLRPMALDMGMVAAIEWLGAEFSRRSSIPCTIDVQPKNIVVDEARAVVFFRIVQESLTNIARHAEATQVEIRLDCRGETLRLEVSDNGRGFLLNARSKRRAFGLLGMRERSLALGGTLDIRSTPGLGTVVVVLIPINETAMENIAA